MPLRVCVCAGQELLLSLQCGSPAVVMRCLNALQTVSAAVDPALFDLVDHSGESRPPLRPHGLPLTAPTIVTPMLCGVPCCWPAWAVPDVCFARQSCWCASRASSPTANCPP